jgi:CheY-like chemotaxis protein
MIGMRSKGFDETAVGAPSWILVVEHDPVIRRAMSQALREAGGFAVALCDRGGKAHRRARHSRPDLLLPDTNLPDMDGQAVQASIRRNPKFADPPVVFVTHQAMTASG